MGGSGKSPTYFAGKSHVDGRLGSGRGKLGSGRGQLDGGRLSGLTSCRRLINSRFFGCFRAADIFVPVGNRAPAALFANARYCAWVLVFGVTFRDSLPG